jgi:hypothetical protein
VKTSKAGPQNATALIMAIAALASLAILWSSPALGDPDDLSETEIHAEQAKKALQNCLTPAALQIASELNLSPLFSRLQKLDEHSKHKKGEPVSPECAVLRLEISEVVITTMLQCQEVIAQIDSETAAGLAIKASMEDKRDRAVKTNSYANIIANGAVTGSGSMLQMPFETVTDSRYELPGEALESAGALMAGTLGGWALHQSAGDKLSYPIKPNMLAKIFKRPNDADTEYPDVIWRYLNSVPPNSGPLGLSRRQELIRRWEDLGRIPPQNTVKGRTYMRIIAGTIPQNKSITISMLRDRAAMLQDLKGVVSQIYKELLNIMLTARAL